MRWSKLFIPTLREDPAEAKNATHRLLIRAGYMRRQDYLFLGRRTLRKIVEMIRREMDAIGGQEMLTTSANGMAAIASELRSYKQLPQIWYEFQGFQVNCRVFEMDSQEGLAKCSEALRRIFEGCGLSYIAGGREFVALSENGDAILSGPGYAASLEMAEGRPKPPAIPDPEGELSPAEFHTPGQKTIADISTFTGLPETSQMKSVVMIVDGKPVLVMLRGDHQLSEMKLRVELSAEDLRPATAAEIREWFGADAGSLGPVGVRNVQILADEALLGRRNMICGANRNDYHLQNVTPGEDFTAEFADLRVAAPGDASIVDGEALTMGTGITLARWSRRIARDSVTSESGEQAAVASGGCEIFLDGVLDSAIGQHHDSDGIALPAAVAPFTVVVTPVSNDPAQQAAARELYDSLRAAEMDVLLDDRDERPGVKFKDADLIGIPYRVTVGKKLAQGLVEIRNRRERTSEDVALSGAASFLTEK